MNAVCLVSSLKHRIFITVSRRFVCYVCTYMYMYIVYIHVHTTIIHTVFCSKYFTRYYLSSYESIHVICIYMYIQCTCIFCVHTHTHTHIHTHTQTHTHTHTHRIQEELVVDKRLNLEKLQDCKWLFSVTLTQGKCRCISSYYQTSPGLVRGGCWDKRCYHNAIIFVCVCVCVCARARVRACVRVVCVCVLGLLFTPLLFGICMSH